jgi:hypothetical protein
MLKSDVSKKEAKLPDVSYEGPTVPYLTYYSGFSKTRNGLHENEFRTHFQGEYPRITGVSVYHHRRPPVTSAPRPHRPSRASTLQCMEPPSLLAPLCTKGTGRGTTARAHTLLVEGGVEHGCRCTSQYMSSSLCVSMTQSEVGLAVHVSTQPSAFCSSERNPHPETSIVPETSLPAHAEHAPARQAYGSSSMLRRRMTRRESA